MTVKTYDIKGEFYAIYTNVRTIGKSYNTGAFVLWYEDSSSEKLSIQEITMEVE